jgi:hypothetical protein
MAEPVTAVTPETQRVVRPGVLAGVVAIALGISSSMTVIWLSMRGVMQLGGFVASGGPYEIADPAPGWIWLLPVSIVLLVVLMFASSEMNSAFDTPSLMLVAWSLLFLSLGVNFLDFGIRSPGSGISIAWLVCAALFFLMGGGGLWALRESVRVGWEYDRKKAEESGAPLRPGFAAYATATGVALVAGVPIGLLLFGAVSP